MGCQSNTFVHKQGVQETQNYSENINEFPILFQYYQPFISKLYYKASLN